MTAVAGHLGALTGRAQNRAVRGGAYASSLISPILFLLCFWAPLRETAPDQPGGFAQYVLPVVLLQATMFVAITAAGDAAEDSDSGMDHRLRTLPVRRWVPVTARMSVPVLSVALAVTGAGLVATALGFRLHGGIIHAVGALALITVFCVAASLGGDALGTRLGDEESTQQALLIPQLLLVMLSTGLVPAAQFPGWIRGFVEHQPVSVIAEAVRTATSDAAAPFPVAAWAWALGTLLCCGAAAVYVQGRRR